MQFRKIETKGIKDLDYAECEDIPDVDISEGLNQIAEQKKKFVKNKNKKKGRRIKKN
jgi:hypothetical protein